MVLGWAKKTGIIAGILILVYTISGFLIIPVIAESLLPNKLKEIFNRQAFIENVSFNPYALSLSLEGLEIREQSGKKNCIAFDRFFINLQWASLFKRALISSETTLANPLVRIVRRTGKKFNFSDLLPAKQKAQKPEEKKNKPLRFSLSDIRISGGRFVFRDEPRKKTHRLTGISFTLPVISNFETDIHTYAEPVLSGTINGTTFKVDASTKPFADSLQTKVAVSLSGIPLSRYSEYLPERSTFFVTGGTLDLKSSVSFSKKEGNKKTLTVSATADLSSLKVADEQASEILSLASAHLEMAPSALLQKHIRIDNLTLTEPELTLLRSTGGELNAAKLGIIPFERDDKKNKPTPFPFVLELKHGDLVSGTIRFRDFAAQPVTETKKSGAATMLLHNVNVNILDFSNKAGHRAHLKFSSNLNSDASLSMNGGFGTVPLSADMAINVKNLPLNRTQHYLPRSLQVIVSGGRLDLSGNARLRMNSDERLGAQFTGNAEVSNLVLSEQKSGRTLTKCRSFDLKGIEMNWPHPKVTLERLALSDVSQNVVREEDGTLNLRTVYLKEPGNTRRKRNLPEALLSVPVSIKEVTLTGISVSFTDHRVDPDYSCLLTFAEGSIKTLSPEPFERADISITGALNDHAPLTITGSINPAPEKRILDLHLDLRNLELAPLSPYAEKHIGHTIEKGKLNLILSGMVNNGKLEANNRILLDQFTLGRQVESPAAVDLPVGFAIALLKDRDGNIDLDLPVSGQLDDPQVSLPGLFIQSLKNIPARAAASPFSLVSAIIPGSGEELRYIEFRPGQENLTKTAREKLESIQTLLYKRPELQIELTGYVNRKKDGQALKKSLIEQKIHAAKQADISTKTKTDSDHRENGVLSSEEYKKYLRRVYNEEVLPETSVQGEETTLPEEELTVGEMAEKIRESITIDDEELRRLAQKRVKTVKDFILQDKRLSGTRLFFRTPESLSPPDPENFKASRVELTLK